MAKFTTTTISNYNQSPPPDDGSTGDDNLIKWSGIKTKLSDPTKNYIDSIQNNVKTAFGNLYVNIEEYSSDLETAVNAIGASKTTLVIKSSTTVSNDVTVPSNITLMFLHGGDLNISATKTVTVNGGIEAGRYQIFTGAGSVIAGSTYNGAIWAEWFGVVLNDDAATDSTTNMVSALNFAAGRLVQCGPGHIRITSDLTNGLTASEIRFKGATAAALLHHEICVTSSKSFDLDSAQIDNLTSEITVIQCDGCNFLGATDTVSVYNAFTGLRWLENGDR